METTEIKQPEPVVTFTTTTTTINTVTLKEQKAVTPTISSPIQTDSSQINSSNSNSSASPSSDTINPQMKEDKITTPTATTTTINIQPLSPVKRPEDNIKTTGSSSSSNEVSATPVNTISTPQSVTTPTTTSSPLPSSQESPISGPVEQPNAKVTEHVATHVELNEKQKVTPTIITSPSPLQPPTSIEQTPLKAERSEKGNTQKLILSETTTAGQDVKQKEAESEEDTKAHLEATDTKGIDPVAEKKSPSDMDHLRTASQQEQEKKKIQPSPTEINHFDDSSIPRGITNEQTQISQSQISNTPEKIQEPTGVSEATQAVHPDAITEDLNENEDLGNTQTSTADHTVSSTESALREVGSGNTQKEEGNLVEKKENKVENSPEPTIDNPSNPTNNSNEAGIQSREPQQEGRDSLNEKFVAPVSAIDNNPNSSDNVITNQEDPKEKEGSNKRLVSASTAEPNSTHSKNAPEDIPGEFKEDVGKSPENNSPEDSDDKPSDPLQASLEPNKPEREGDVAKSDNKLHDEKEQINGNPLPSLLMAGDPDSLDKQNDVTEGKAEEETTESSVCEPVSATSKQSADPLSLPSSPSVHIHKPEAEKEQDMEGAQDKASQEGTEAQQEKTDSDSSLQQEQNDIALVAVQQQNHPYDTHHKRKSEVSRSSSPAPSAWSTHSRPHTHLSSHSPIPHPQTPQTSHTPQPPGDQGTVEHHPHPQPDEESPNQTEQKSDHSEKAQSDTPVSGTAGLQAAELGHKEQLDVSNVHERIIARLYTVKKSAAKPKPTPQQLRLLEIDRKNEAINREMMLAQRYHHPFFSSCYD